MTKKEEILKFIEESLNDSNQLQLQTIIQETNEMCVMTIGATKPRVKEILSNNFNDELLGSMPNDQTIHKIESWGSKIKPS